MTFQLKSVGPYRIEPTEEYIPGAADNSYAEMIRVRGSKPEPPYFVVPSHLYKYSESELGLYLHERKNLWRELGKLLKARIDISDRETMVNFPISLFPDVAKIVPFVKKALRKNPLTEEEKRKIVLNLRKSLLSASRGMNLNGAKLREKDGGGKITQDDASTLANRTKNPIFVHSQRERALILDSFAIKEVPA